MEKQMNIPPLRFPEFEGEWTRNNFGDIVKINQGLQIPISERFLEQVEDSHFYITNEFLRDNSEKKYFIKNPPNSVICKKDDILMTRTGNTGMVVTNVEGAFHNNFFKIAYPKNVSKGFLYNFLKLPNTQKQIIRLAGTSTIPDLNHSDFYKIEFTYPTIEEQTKIASFLTAVDEKIQALKKKHSLLEQYKKGLMQKLFSQELRFKDENGNDFPEWAMKKLGEVCECLDNLRKPLNDSQRQQMQGIIPYWGANNIMDYIDDFIFDEPIVLLAEDGGNFNDFNSRAIANYFEQKCWVNNHTHVLKGISTVLDTKYLYYSVVHKDITGFVSGGTRSKLTKTEMLKIKIPIPCLAEQTAIANFLSALDEKINQTQIHIDKMETWKKGLLQKMFV